jgi:hypothetical protein
MSSSCKSSGGRRVPHINTQLRIILRDTRCNVSVVMRFTGWWISACRLSNVWRWFEWTIFFAMSEITFHFGSITSNYSVRFKIRFIIMCIIITHYEMKQEKCSIDGYVSFWEHCKLRHNFIAGKFHSTQIKKLWTGPLHYQNNKNKFAQFLIYLNAMPYRYFLCQIGQIKSKHAMLPKNSKKYYLKIKYSSDIYPLVPFTFRTKITNYSSHPSGMQNIQVTYWLLFSCDWI